MVTSDKIGKLFFAVIRQVVSDANLLYNSLIIGLGLGVLYTFMSEGAFYCIEYLSMSSEAYGTICAAGSIIYATGCSLTNRLIRIGISYQKVMVFGVAMMAVAFIAFDCFIFSGWISLAQSSEIATVKPFLIILMLWVFSSLGLSFTLTPCFANALEHQRDNAGVAASMFAFTYNFNFNLGDFIDVMASYLKFVRNAQLLLLRLSCLFGSHVRCCSEAKLPQKTMLCKTRLSLSDHRDFS